MPTPPTDRLKGRNSEAEWQQLFNRDIVSMPDKWEYPWVGLTNVTFYFITPCTLERIQCHVLAELCIDQQWSVDYLNQLEYIVLNPFESFERVFIDCRKAESANVPCVGSLVRRAVANQKKHALFQSIVAWLVFAPFASVFLL